MYYWNLKQLKQKLAQGPLPTAEQFDYLLGTTLLYCIGAIPFFNNNGLDFAMWAINTLVMCLGTGYFYYCNGAESGQDLLNRFLSLNWVFGLRFLVLIAIPTMLTLILIYYIVLGVLHENTMLSDVIVIEVLVTVYYYFLGQHVREVAHCKPS